MSIVVGANTGARAAKEPNDAYAAAIAFGISASLTLTTGGTSVNISLPVDANGNLYPAYQINADANSWFIFGTANSDAATVAGANNYLVNAAAPPLLVATPQSVLRTGSGYIAAVSSTAGAHVCVTGIF